MAQLKPDWKWRCRHGGGGLCLHLCSQPSGSVPSRHNLLSPLLVDTVKNIYIYMLLYNININVDIVGRYICICSFPQQSSSGINSGWILALMPPTSWAWTLASLLSVVLYFNVASQVVRRAWGGGIRLVNTEIDLFPFRLTFIIICVRKQSSKVRFYIHMLSL